MPAKLKPNTTTKPYLQNMKPYSKSNEPVKMLTEKEMTRQKKDRLKTWITFYRLNPSFFIEHYMGIILFPYQRFWINLISRSTQFLGYASRASAKSWLIGVYAIARCILYPGTVFTISSSTKQQAGIIISEKCKMLHDESTNIQRETLNIVTNQNKWEMAFHNGSKIKVVISGEGGRGNRANITILEERRLIPNEVIDSIIRPFLVSRTPPYMKNMEYANIEELREEPIEIIITSVYYKSYEWYPEAIKFLKKVVNGDKDIKFVILDYLISLKHGIKTKKQMISDKANFDPISFMMEYGNIPYGSSSNAFYKLGFFRRTIKRAWRPMTDEMFVTTKKNPYAIPKNPEEVRLVGVDIAMRAGSTNDNTIIVCARLFPSKKGWQTEVVYLESHNGKNTYLQALRIKQIYEEFEGDVMILDIANAGISVYDSLSAVTKDEVRGVEYPAYSVVLQDAIDDKLYTELKARTLGQEPKECIFPIYANAPLNSAIAVRFRERLKKRLITFLVDDNIEEEFLIKSGNKDILDQDDTGIRAYLLQAHLQTSLLINEAISLELKMMNGLVKLEEPAGGRKDRYTACSYLNYYVSLMDVDLLKDRNGLNDEQEFLGVSLFF